jgi:hypothetical protein
MNTPAHLIFGAAAFGKPADRRVTLSALAGAMMPDVSLYLMVSWSIYVQNISPRIVFGQYYYSPEWQRVFAVDNSFVLWGMVLAMAWWARKPALIAFAGAGFLHLCFDFPLHNHDARMHFWPLSDWVFISPFSYWDNNFHAGIVGPFELSLAMACIFLLVVRHKSLMSRGFFLLLGLGELVATGFFGWYF